MTSKPRLGITGYPFDDYDGTDESFEKLIESLPPRRTPKGYYEVHADGIPWQDADGNDRFTVSEATAVVAVLQAQGYRNVKLVRL